MRSVGKKPTRHSSPETIVPDNQPSLPAAFWLRSKQKASSHDGTSEALGDGRHTQRRVCALLVQAALWAPAMGEKDALLEVLQELDWEGPPTDRWLGPEASHCGYQLQPRPVTRRSKAA